MVAMTSAHIAPRHLLATLVLLDRRKGTNATNAPDTMFHRPPTELILLSEQVGTPNGASLWIL